MLVREELADLVAKGEIDTVLTVFPDMYGRLMGKRITGHFFLSEVLEQGMHVCDYLLACDMEMDPVPGYRFASWAKGYGDVLCKPDLHSLRRAAWTEKAAVVICDLYGERDGLPVAVSPRAILKAQLERAAARGLVAKAGSELELFLFREDYEEAAAKNFDDLSTFGWYVEDYHTLSPAAEEPLIGSVRRAMDASGIPVEFSKGEWGPGQHEINLRYAEMLEMADRHVIYKQAVKELAMQQGLSVTYMAKFDENLAGNSCHLHSSLWRAEDGRSVFAGEQALAGTPVSCSEEFRWYLGGLLARAGESSLFFAPNVNSYKRYRPATFAPTAIAWSWDNRTVGFRLVGQGDALRVECRIPGADANPYLVMAATLAAGLEGIEERIEPAEAFSGDAYAASGLPTIPLDLSKALDIFSSSEFNRRAYGDEVVEHYAHFAEVELEKFSSAVTTWERRRYFERV